MHDRVCHGRHREADEGREARERRPDPASSPERQQGTPATRCSGEKSRGKLTLGRAIAPAGERRGPAPFDYKQYGYSFGGPIPGAMPPDKPSTDVCLTADG
jgi:hypothetical protein